MFIPCSRKRMSSRQKNQEMWSCPVLGIDNGDTCSFLSCKEHTDAWQSNWADGLHEFPLCQHRQDTSFNKFQQNHPAPAVWETAPAYSLICKDSCAVLNKQHLCSSWYVWKNVFAAVLLEIKTNTWKDLGWSSQPEQTLFFCTFFCISNPRKGIGSTWDNQDSDNTVGICSAPKRRAWTGFKPQSQTVRSNTVWSWFKPQSQTVRLRPHCPWIRDKKRAGGQQKCHSSVC